MKEVEKETNAALIPGLEHPWYTGRSEPRLDHTPKQGRGMSDRGPPWRSKGRVEGDHRRHHRREPRSGASMPHGGKGFRIGSSREARPRNGSLWTGHDQQRPQGSRPSPLGAQDRNIQGSTPRTGSFKAAPKEVEKLTSATQSPGSEHPRYKERSDPGLDHLGEQGRGPNHPRLPRRSQNHVEGDQDRSEPSIGA